MVESALANVRMSSSIFKRKRVEDEMMIHKFASFFAYAYISSGNSTKKNVPPPKKKERGNMRAKRSHLHRHSRK